MKFNFDQICYIYYCLFLFGPTDINKVASSKHEQDNGAVIILNKYLVKK